MRIIFYNILDGGEGRADPLAEVIEAQRPDVVGLVESANLSVVERIARRLDFDYVQAIGRQANTASTLLSRYPIRDSINHALLQPGLTKSLLHATITTPDFGDLPLAIVHLHDGAYKSDEQIREAELSIVLDTLAAHRTAGRPHLLLGDFNANAPTQQIDPARCHDQTRAAHAANGNALPRRVVQRLLDAGYTDTLHAVHPAVADTTATFTTNAPGQRVDYIFTHSIDPKRITGVWVEQDRLATYASDHYPTCAEIV